MKQCNNSICGQSLIEVIIAVSLLVIFATGAVVAVLGSFVASRLAEEETQAAYLATEGLEAVKSIRDQNWNGLTNNNHGLSNANGFWEFLGESDMDTSEKYTRVITISDVERDTNGDIVQSGGTIDPDTKKAVAEVSWHFLPSGLSSVVETIYLTNWQAGRYNYPGSSSACNNFCISISYTQGICRNGAAECTANGETAEAKGNRYCSSEAHGATCCCKP